MHILLKTISIFSICILSFAAAAQEIKNLDNLQAETEVQQQILNRKEREQLQKQQMIAKERAEESNRFKRKAMERAAERERQLQEQQKIREQNASRFQRAAMEEDAKKVAEQKGLINAPAEKSRFSLKAEQRAQERAEKERQKLERINSRRSKN